MKKVKKALLLGLTVAMSATLFAACGGKGGDGGVKGEILADESAWVQALTDTVEATNATISGTVKGEGRMGEFYYKRSGTILSKVASGRVYTLLDFTYDSNMEEMFAPQQKVEYYHGVVDGVVQEWSKEGDGEWEQETRAPEEFTGTIGFALMQFAEFPLEYLYNAYLNFENVGDTYVWEVSGESGSQTVEFKFSDGKLYSYAIKVLSTREEEGEAYTTSSEMTFTITYGNTSVGALPGQEDEPDDGNSSNSGSQGGSAGGEIVGGEVVLPKGEQVNAENWTAAIAATMATDNFFAEVGMEGFDETEENVLTSGYGIISIADNKGYTEMMQEMLGYGTFRMYSYCGNVDGKNYVWESEDGESWSVEEVGDAITIDGAWMVEELLPEDLAFENWTYDETTGGYSYAWDDTLTITVGIIDGKIGFLHTVSTDAEDQPAPIMIEKYLFTYGNATVGALPPVQNAGGNNESVSGGMTDNNSTTNVQDDKANN